MSARTWIALPLLAAAVLTGCSDEPAEPAAPAAPAPSPSSDALDVVALRVGSASLQVEVADDEASRRAGLRGRAAVPAGTGMVFRFGGPSTSRFTMSGVTYPLVSVFVRDRRVIAVNQMPPCAGSLSSCPTYGAAEPYDEVVEAAPMSLPDVRVGDPVS